MGNPIQYRNPNNIHHKYRGGLVITRGGLIIMHLSLWLAPPGRTTTINALWLTPPGRTTTGGLMKTLHRHAWIAITHFKFPATCQLRMYCKWSLVIRDSLQCLLLFLNTSNLARLEWINNWFGKQGKKCDHAIHKKFTLALKLFYIQKMLRYNRAFCQKILTHFAFIFLLCRRCVKSESCNKMSTWSINPCDMIEDSALV